MNAKEFLASQKDAGEVDQLMLVAMAVLGYKGSGIEKIEGIKRIAEGPQTYGHDAIAIYHAASRTVVMVNRGAEGGRSLEDWIRGAEAAILKDFRGPLTIAVDFLDTVLGGIARKTGLGGVTHDMVGEVLTTGHSWGGALAEAHVVFGPTLVAKHDLGSLPLSGLGIGSAGFARAITALAADRGVAMPRDMSWKMHHYIRQYDAIMWQPAHRLLGQRNLLPSIFQSIPVQNRNSTFNFNVIPANLVNHDSELYFAHFNLSADNHIYRTRKGMLFLLQGPDPERTQFAMQDPDRIIPLNGTPLP
jgi:hypothetical protein